MLNGQGMDANTMGQQFIEGTPVYDVNGDKVGDVSEHGMQRGALVIHKGLFFPKDLYVPLDAIRGSDANGIYLNVTKGDMHNKNWQTPPPETATADRGIQGQPRMTETTTTTGYTPANRTADRSASTSNDTVIPVREEELIAEKQRQQVGDVQVHRTVEEQQQRVSAPVMHEEVRVERVATSGNTPVGADAFTDKDIDVPLMGEQLNVSKEAHVTEEVRLHKDRVVEQQQATGTVRREHVEIDDNASNLGERGREDLNDRNTRP